MTCCTATDKQPSAAHKACSGKCGNGACGIARVWVLAACEGMISLFEKQEDGHLALLRQGEGSVAPSIEAFRSYLGHAIKNGQFTQLVLVGGAGDIAWARLSLPAAASRFVVAEIQYPLVPAWFRQPPGLGQMKQALEQLFVA